MTREQYLLLCNLIYLKEFTDEAFKNQTVREIIDQIEKEGKKIEGCEMSDEEWRESLPYDTVDVAGHSKGGNKGRIESEKAC